MANNWYDGDTLYDENGGHRIIGGDTPEMLPPLPGSRQARDAAARADELGYELRDTGGVDLHGRALANQVSPTGGPTAMQEMVADGLAKPCTGLASKRPRSTKAH